MPAVVAATGNHFGQSKPHRKIDYGVQPERACVRHDARQRSRADDCVAGDGSDVCGIG